MFRILAGAVRALVERLAMLLVLLVCAHAAVGLLPGNGVRALLGKEATADQIARTEHQLGLDQPWPERFLAWISGLARGDLGRTLRGQPIGDVIGTKFPNTLLLGALALLIAGLLALACGSWWALHPRGLFARAVSSTSSTSIAVPEFVVAAMLVLVFAVWLCWLPAVTMPDSAGRPANLSMLVLPTLALAIPQAGWNIRVVRAALVDAGSSPAVHAATLDGLDRATILRRIMVPAALPTIATSLATTIGPLLAGAVVVETVFNYPGVGSVLAASVADRDANLALAVVALTATAVLALLVLADLVRLCLGSGRS